MNLLREKFQASPIYARFAPFLIFVGLMAFNGVLGKDGQYWMYAVRTGVGLWLILEMRPFVPEMRWAISLEAIAVGIAMCVMWIALNPYVPQNHVFFTPTPGDEWNPFARFGEGSGLAWFFAAVRILGSSLVVPPLEEVFWRSFLYRYSIRTDFQSVPLNRFHPTAFIVISLLFGLEHYQFVQGFLFGMAMQWLVIKKNRLGDAIVAHAITNFLLGLWVVGRHDWQFW
ncbi:MAG TPA: CAAX prenyl protease-related protein [Verrucomicrobiae bacterium]|nr:CAAX prenyl protease-related protein [Verrucomicrobiae bacterium]